MCIRDSQSSHSSNLPHPHPHSHPTKSDQPRDLLKSSDDDRISAGIWDPKSRLASCVPELGAQLPLRGINKNSQDAEPAVVEQPPANLHESFTDRVHRELMSEEPLSRRTATGAQPGGLREEEIGWERAAYLSDVQVMKTQQSGASPKRASHRRKQKQVVEIADATSVV
eukprot:TRINITY_DN2594_c0_g1_i1.p1 TRINITY_DN2594_c0_g1~~TRINITY_DN2594_c0_g1_i1.p1  ORF type:complete len:169 (-),score=37.14 TRINITY_DN2594_c0_g1_i1:176-682(-)